MQWRINLLLFIFGLLGVLMIGRLFSFQVTNNDYWKALAQGQQKSYTQDVGERGEIYLNSRNNNFHPLAVNRVWEFVYLVPTEAQKEKDEIKNTAKRLGEILEIDENHIIERFNREGSMYERIKNKLTPKEVDAIKKENFSGVYIGKENIRYYPQENLASHIVGFVGGGGEGQYGLEGYFNDILMGTSSFRQSETSSWGKLFFGSSEESQKGKDIYLTIDYNIQFMAEKMLEEAKENLNIESGTILVGDPHTGKILALSNYPNFSPNNYSEEKDLSKFQNRAIQSIFEPGSIFKPITFAMGLEEQKITPQMTYTDKGYVNVGGYTLRNYGRRTWGEQTMTEVLEKSLNTGAIYVQRLIENDVFVDYLDKFEFFQPTGIELQGEVFSRNLSFKEGYEVNFANASFGQGIDVNSIQIFKAFSALANGGKIIDPYIIKGNDKVNQARRVISPGTSSTITSMMISVTEEGFAKTAQVPGYYVAGKTGTAQMSWASLGINRRGYSNKTIQGFVGYAPAMNPAFVIFVKLDNPNANTAEYSAAPIFSNLAKYILDYYQIPPEREK